MVKSKQSRVWCDIACVLALSFIRTVEFPDLLRLRVEMLTENGCNQLALNLVRWCLRCEVLYNDVMLRCHLLLLLHRLNEVCEFDNQVVGRPVLIETRGTVQHIYFVKQYTEVCRCKSLKFCYVTCNKVYLCHLLCTA